MVFQALRHLGADAIDDRVVAQIRKCLSEKQRREFLRDARYTTDWIAGVVHQIAVADEEAVSHG